MSEIINGMDDWIPKVRKTYRDTLLGDQRFLNATSLLSNFDRAADLWAKRPHTRCAISEKTIKQRVEGDAGRNEQDPIVLETS